MRKSLRWALFNTALSLASIAVLAATTFCSDQHLITNSEQFVIVNSEQPQLYRLFGVLPFIKTRTSQIYLVATLIFCLGLPLALFFYLRPRHPYADWTSKLPDWAVNRLYHIEEEYSAYKQIIVGEIMSMMSTPMSVGLDIASTLSMWNPLASSSKRPQKGASSGEIRRIGRSTMRRSSGILNNGASTSKVNDDYSNGHSGSYYNGLYNTGNSCFLNSTLQSLASVDVLERYLHQVMELAEVWDVPTPVTDALYDLIVDLNTPLIKREALLPRQLTDALSNLPRTNVGSFFYAHQQQDAHELLVLLTSAIDDEVTTIMAERDYITRRQAIGLRAVIAPSIPSLYSSSSFASTSTNPFRSLIAQRTACLDCGYVEAVRHYPADELSLGVPYRGPGSATTLEMCLRSWSKLERVEWICFQCSLRKTLDKVQGEVKRLSAGHAVNGHASHHQGSTAANGDITHEAGVSNGKMTNSKKKRLREARRKETILGTIINGQLSEDEVESAHLLDKADIKLERAYSNLATKQVMIARTPKLLSIHLNRSSYSASNFGASKNNTPVLFDEYLDVIDVVTSGELNISGSQPISKGSTPAREAQMKSYIEEKAGEKQMNGNGNHFETCSSETLYRLCAIVVHYGSHSSGHYVSFCRRRLKCPSLSDDVDHKDHDSYDAWFRISDDSVSPCTLRSVLSQNPFILFYERADGDKDARYADDQIRSSGGDKLDGVMVKRIPSGFEMFAKDDLQQKLSIYRPRVVERWNPSVF